MFCRNCGTSVDTQAAYCPNCGAPLAAVPTPDQSPQPPPQAPPPVYSQPGYPPQQYGQPQYTQYPPQDAPKPKKRHGCLIAFIIVLVLLLGAATAVYFLIPGLLRPYDLDIRTSQEAYDSALTKLGYTKDDAPTEGQQDNYKYVYGPVNTINIRMNSEEVTSFMSLNRPAYYPLKNVQVKIASSASMSGGVSTGKSSFATPVFLSAKMLPTSSDAPIEVTGTIDRDYVVDSLLGGQYSQDEIQEAMKSIGIVKLIPDKVNFYIKMSGRIENNKITSLKLYKASVMGVAIPEKYVDSPDAYNIVSGAINMLLQDYNERSSAYFVSIKTSGGEIVVEGQVPSSLTRTPNPS
mgnify:CR=1 FL=1